MATGSASSADSTVGASFAGERICNGGDGDTASSFTVVEQSPAYTVPTAGVVTSWRTQLNPTADSVTSFKVARPSPNPNEPTATQFTIVGSGPKAVVAANQAVFTQPVRIAVKAGDVIGIHLELPADSTSTCARFTSTNANFAFSDGDAAVGQTLTDTDQFAADYNVAATVEPDADGDGYGDTTQDRCATDATTQGACKDTTAPETTITAVKAGKIKATKKGKKAKKKANVSVSFIANEAATFQCSVDGAFYVPCTSPLSVKLKKGTHYIAVRAVDTAGNIDATPARVEVKVKKAKTKKKK